MNVPARIVRPGENAFFGSFALLFAISTAVTIAWCGSMSAMGGMEMPGGWTMSMTWMPMPGQGWLGAAATFTGMWAVMMAAMMLPSLAPMLLRYRRAVGCGGAARAGRLTAIVATAYFFVWTLLGAAAFPIGIRLANLEMEHPAVSRAVPLAAGIVVLVAGVLQLTRWKERRLACCREAPEIGRVPAATATSAWRCGLRLGIRCVACCAGLTAILLVAGVMDLRAMAIVGAATTAERLAPRGERVARAVGVVVMAAGLIVITRALGVA